MKRRNFINSMAAGMSGYAAARLLGGGYAAAAAAPANWRSAGRLKAAVETRNTARNLIFILLEGGASHVDTFDLKLNRETPASLGAQDLGGFQWPSGIMPKLASKSGQFSLVRSLTAVEAVHERAVYHLTTAHRQDASRAAEIPHFGSMMSYKLAGQRRPGDSLPTVVLFGLTMAQNGFFPIEHRGLNLSEDGSIPNLAHELPNGKGRFDLLNDLLGRMDSVTDKREERVRIQRQAQQMMNDTELRALFGADGDGENEGGEDSPQGAFRRQCESVTRLLSADRGARVVQMFLGGWDHHFNIYAPQNLPALAGALDDGLAYLLDSLAAKPGKNGGSLLDETLIVAAGEFGRTVNGLNESMGRDHYPYAMSALFAGGGVKTGRVIGQTDQTGGAIVDAGWSKGRYMGIGDLAATMYSALGIDWTEQFTDTPSGRLFEMTPTNVTGPVYDIDPLFV